MSIEHNINNLGANLSVIIHHAVPCDPWASFSLWYSVNRVLPQAQTLLYMPRKLGGSLFHMNWPRRVGLPVRYYHHEPVSEERLSEAFTKLSELGRRGLSSLAAPPWLVLSSWTVAARELDAGTLDYLNKQTGVAIDRTAPGLISDCRGSQLTTFITYDESCGKFQKERWRRHESRPPLLFTDKLRTPSMSINEHKVIGLWEDLRDSFLAAERV